MNAQQDVLGPLVETLSKLLEERLALDGIEFPPPPAGAPADKIAAAEEVIGKKLPESYRRFLAVRDGFQNYWPGMNLVSTEQYLMGAHGGLRKEVLEVIDEEEQEEEVTAVLDKSVIIGWDGEDGDLLLMQGEEVVHYYYKDVNRWSSLTALFEERIASLSDGIAKAAEAKARIAREREETFRSESDRALAEALAPLVRDFKPEPRGALPAVSRPSFFEGALKVLLEGPSGLLPRAVAFLHERFKETSPSDLQIHAARVDLGLTLYLGHAPRPEEMVSAVEAFKRHFPKYFAEMAGAGSYAWGGMSSVESPEGVDWMELASRLDSQGECGVMLGKPGTWTLEFRALPPLEEDEEEEQGAPPQPRAVFCEIMLPADADPEALYGLALELADLLPVRSGHAGFTLQAHPDRCDSEDKAELRGWLKRYSGLDFQETEGFLPYLLDRVKSGQWLTILGAPFLDALGTLTPSDKLTVEKRAKALVLRAGEKPTLGDLQKGGFPEGYAEADRLIAPLRVAGYRKTGEVSLGGWTAATEALDILPLDGGETALWLNRFQRPDRWLGATSRELGEEIEAAAEAKDFKKAAAALEKLAESGTWHKGLDHVLIKAALAAGETGENALGHRLSEVTIQIPNRDLAAFTNLLYFAMRLKEEAKIRRAVEAAVPHGPNNPAIFYNAACAHADLGEKEQAFDYIRKAREHEYDNMELVYKDDSFDAYRGNPEFEALFK